MSEQQSKSSMSDSAEDNSKPDLDLLDYLLILAKHKLIILSVTFTMAVLSVLYSLTLKNIYTANTMIVVTEDDKGVMGALLGSVGGAAGGAAALAGVGGPTRTDLYVTMLKTDAIKDPIIDRFKLMQEFKSKNRTLTYKRLAGKTKVTAGKRDGVISISVSDNNPKLAADLANAYVDELGKMATGMTMGKSARNRQFLEERLATTKINLIKAEDALKIFQSKNKIFDAPEQAKISIRGVAQLHARLAVQEMKLASLKNQFTDSSHEVKTAAAAVANTKSQITKLEGSGGGGAVPSVGNVPELGQEYVRLLREFKVQETLFELLTKQHEMARFSEAKDVSPVQVIQVAKVPEMKSKPARSKIVLLTTALSFILTVAFVFMNEFVKQMPVTVTDKMRELKYNIFKFRFK